MAQTKIEKAMKIFNQFSHMDSAKVKAKIAKACDMSLESASSYYYTCKNRAGNTSKTSTMALKKSAVKRRR